MPEFEEVNVPATEELQVGIAVRSVAHDQTGEEVKTLNVEFMVGPLSHHPVPITRVRQLEGGGRGLVSSQNFLGRNQNRS